MKRMLLALTMIGLVLPFAPGARGESDVSLNFFYSNLSSQGNWLDVADYGYCFQPNVAAGNNSWRPYTDGYWAYTDAGWTWVSYEDFGWATYHYGRWARLADYGWIWVPGYEWAPAWVSWRIGGDYVGWAPLPPAADQVYEGRAITGPIDVEFDIGPQCYNFIDVRYIGEPVLRERILELQRNVTLIERTVNVTRISYNNSTIYNYGPDYNSLNQYSIRPIPRLSMQRETSASAALGAQGGNFNRISGNQLVVIAPVIQRSQQKLIPRQVKAQVPQPKFTHGWDGIADRAKLQDEMKKENVKRVAPPGFQPQKDRKREAVRPRATNKAVERAEQPAAPAAAARPPEVGQPEKEAAHQRNPTKKKPASEPTPGP